MTQYHLAQELSEEEFSLFRSWLDMNKGLNSDEFFVEKNLLNGIRIMAQQERTGEWWEIDFVRDGDEQK